MRMPHVWAVELMSVGVSGWNEVYSGNEHQARAAFVNIEAECAGHQRGHTEIKLWHGEKLLLHIWWNRGMPNKPDGMRDWSR